MNPKALHDLLHLRVVLRQELAEMRAGVERIESCLNRGDELLRNLGGFIDGASASSEAMQATTTGSTQVVEEGKSEPQEMQREGTQDSQDGRRRTAEQDLEEYLSGLPEMEAVKLPLRNK